MRISALWFPMSSKFGVSWRHLNTLNAVRHRFGACFMCFLCPCACKGMYVAWTLCFGDRSMQPFYRTTEKGRSRSCFWLDREVLPKHSINTWLGIAEEYLTTPKASPTETFCDWHIGCQLQEIRRRRRFFVCSSSFGHLVWSCGCKSISSYLSASTRHFFVIAHFSTSRYASNNSIGKEGASKLGESIANLTNLSSLDINL